MAEMNLGEVDLEIEEIAFHAKEGGVLVFAMDRSNKSCCFIHIKV